MKKNPNNLLSAAIYGIRFGLLIGLGAALLEVILPGFHRERMLQTILYCTVGSLLGALLLHGAKAVKAYYQHKRPPPDAYGKDI